MEILNYTGKNIGLATKSGVPVRGLPTLGKAYSDTSLKDLDIMDRVTVSKIIYGTVKGLPPQDSSLQTMYIVNDDVIEVEGIKRRDLLKPIDPIQIGPDIFYKRLINV
jgi:hypothetical protein